MRKYLLILATAGFVSERPAYSEAPTPSVLIVVGPSTHPPGTHEVGAGARVVEHCLKHAENVRPFDVTVVQDWPTEPAVLARSATVVFFGDLFPPERFEARDRAMNDLEAMTARGCGVVCVHYATGLNDKQVPDDGAHPLLRWTGGYFATRCRHHQSVAKIFTATITPTASEHPVLRGWKAFTLLDEPYYNNFFGSGGMAPNVTPLAQSLLPPENPKPEVVAWAVERADGGRGMGIVMPHFYKNWQNDDLRTLILNGVVWSAKAEVPSEGVRTTLADLKAFAPASIEPVPRPAKAK